MFQLQLKQLYSHEATTVFIYHHSDSYIPLTHWQYYIGVASSIPARYHTFVEIDHEIISTVILLPSADLFKKGCCQLQAKVCAQITG